MQKDVLVFILSSLCIIVVQQLYYYTTITILLNLSIDSNTVDLSISSQCCLVLRYWCFFNVCEERDELLLKRLLLLTVSMQLQDAREAMRVVFFCTRKTYLYVQNEISYEYIQILF